MRYVVGAMMAVFALIGAGLAWNGLALLWRLWWRSWDLVERDGTIVSLDRESSGLAMRRTSRGRRGRHGHTAQYPVIRFTPPDGEPITFRSTIGELGPPFRYHLGQRVRVLHDTGGVLPPRMLAGRSRWTEPALLIVVGVVFLGASALIAGLHGRNGGYWQGDRPISRPPAASASGTTPSSPRAASPRRRWLPPGDHPRG